MDNRKQQHLLSASERLFQEVSRTQLRTYIEESTANGNIADLFPEYKAQRVKQETQSSFAWLLVYGLAAMGVLLLGYIIQAVFPEYPASYWVVFTGLLIALTLLGRRIHNQEKTLGRKIQNKKLRISTFAFAGVLIFLVVSAGLAGLASSIMYTLSLS